MGSIVQRSTLYVPNETKQCQTDLQRATARSRERYVIILQDLVSGDLTDIHVII